jgi:hypothetical protein
MKMKTTAKKLMSVIIIVITLIVVMVSCKGKDQFVIQKNDRLIDLGERGSVLVTDRCVVVMRDSTYFNKDGGGLYHTIATKVYTLSVTPVTNNIKLLNNDTVTVRALSKEQIDEFKKRMGKNK